MENYCLMGTGFQFYKMKGIMGMDSNEGWTMMGMYLIQSIKNG